jgi:hypothetical protein
MTDAALPIHTTPPGFGHFERPLVNFAKQLKGKEPIKIVAIGSSSTAGEGGIPPYPCRLEMKLRDRFQGRTIDVLNRGIGGQEAPVEQTRFDADVIGVAPPALVIWQVGTNAVWQLGHDLDTVVAAIVTGLDRLSRIDTDVVLMDLQYAPAIIQPHTIDAANRMVSEIATAAGNANANANVFRRFALMKHWHEQDHIPFTPMIDQTDQFQLHQSDLSTDWVAQALADMIGNTATGAA